VARHAFAEHTGELEIELEAETLAELFAEAARALAEVIGGPPDPAAPPAPGAAAGREAIRIEAPDRDALLVAWIDELIFLSERDKVIVTEVRIDTLSDRALDAEVATRAIEDVHLAVKAATFHGLAITERAGDLIARVVLDV
jgi:SHS2 domain-containing protein